MTAQPRVDWKLEGREIRGLTLHRPWPWAFTHADKRVENRTWPPPDHILDGWIALHSGQQYDLGAEVRMATGDFGAAAEACPLGDDKHLSGVITAVALLDHFEPRLAPTDPWAFGPFCWHFCEVWVLPRPVPCKGARGLWRLRQDTFEAIAAAWPKARQV